MVVASEQTANEPRNPGPSWGFRVIHFWDTLLPTPVARWVRTGCAWVALGIMHRQRAASREYMKTVLGRRAGLRDCAKQFDSFVTYLCDRISTAFGEPVHFEWAPGHGREFVDLMKRKETMLMGTFHVGYSDLMGFFMAEFDRPIHMLRLRLANAEDTERLEAFAGEHVKIVWVNEIEDALFSIKEVIAQGGAVAMQCDRVQHASKLEVFEFLGAHRYFPFTIYWLSILFEVPVQFTIAGIRSTRNASVPVFTSPVFRPVQSNRKENLQAAKQHFQGVLKLLEQQLKAQPEMWFNFEPLNPTQLP
ncbi:MAG: hypothetical protein ABQ298_12700 [Puniceicoccaceae bacterium]